MKNLDKFVTLGNMLLLCALLTGCSGMNRDLLYRPLAPLPPDSQEPLGREKGNSWQLDLGDAEFGVLPVTLSSKLTMLFGPLVVIPTFWSKDVPEEGPLIIGVFVKAQDDVSVAFDPREFTVVLEDGRTLLPDSARQNQNTEAEPLGPVEYSGGQNWLWLTYDVALADLKPFTLQLGTLHVNGKAIHIPPISFVRGKSSRSV